MMTVVEDISVVMLVSADVVVKSVLVPLHDTSKNMIDNMRRSDPIFLVICTIMFFTLSDLNGLFVLVMLISLAKSSHGDISYHVETQDSYSTNGLSPSIETYSLPNNQKKSKGKCLCLLSCGRGS